MVWKFEPAVFACAPGFAPPRHVQTCGRDSGVCVRLDLLACRRIRLAIGQGFSERAGSGFALGDVDGDGRCDLYFCRLEGPNALYRNRGGWKFEDIAASAGVACEGQFSTGATLADVDGDGDLDLLVNALGAGTRLFLNDGKGHFQEAT